MGRLLLILLVVVAVVLLWKAFGPGSRKQDRSVNAGAQQPAIKGPDDDEDFLWSLEKQRFKERREQEAKEEAARVEEERRRRRQQPREQDPPDEAAS